MRVTCGNPRMSVVCLSAWNASRRTPDQGTAIVMDLWTTPDRLVMTDDRLATCAWPSRVLTSDGEQDKTDLRPTCDYPQFSLHEFAAELGPDRINMGVSSEELSIWSLTGTCDPMSILCHSYVDPMSLTSHSRFTLEALTSCVLCHSAKIDTLEKYQEWHTTNLWGTCNRHTSQPRVGHSGKVFRSFGTVPYGRGTCAERWRAPPPPRRVIASVQGVS